MNRDEIKGNWLKWNLDKILLIMTNDIQSLLSQKVLTSASGLLSSTINS